MVIGRAGLADLSAALRKAEARLGREVNVTAYSPEEFREKIKSGDHFLTAVLRGRKQFVKGGQSDLDELIGKKGGIKRYSSGGIIRMHALRPWRARASGVLLHGTGTETADELTLVNNHRPSIFLARPSRSTWLTAVQNGWPVAGFNATLK